MRRAHCAFIAPIFKPHPRASFPRLSPRPTHRRTPSYLLRQSRLFTIMSISSSSVVHDSAEHIFRLVHPASPTKPAFLQYVPISHSNTPVYDLRHTFVPPELRGKGVAGVLVKGALDIIRENGGKILPTCSYIPVYLKRNEDDRDLVFEE